MAKVPSHPCNWPNSEITPMYSGFLESELEIINSALLEKLVEKTPTDPEPSHEDEDYLLFQPEDWFTLDKHGPCDI